MNILDNIGKEMKKILDDLIALLFITAMMAIFIAVLLSHILYR